jgi:uncharacterized membrane protein YqjE
MDETPHAEGGILATLTRMLKTLRDVAENRVELLLVEWKEERLRLLNVLLLAAAGMLCALMTLVMVTLTVVVVFWDTHRVLVLVLVTAAYAGAAAATFGALRSRLRKWQAFSATLDQIKKDRACFEKSR